MRMNVIIFCVSTHKKLLMEVKNMFCKSCGAQIDEGQTVCPNCGTPVQPDQPVPQPVQPQQPVHQPNKMAVNGLVLGCISIAFAVISWFVLWWLSVAAIVMGIVGTVLSAVGLSRSNHMQGSGKGAAIGGLVTSILAVVVAIIALIVLFTVLAAALS